MKKQTIYSLILALAAVTGVSSSAQAANAFTTTNVNVRSGPGTSYGVVGVLSAGTRVQLNQCRDDWCNIEQGSLHGWASKPYLDKIKASVVVVPVPIIIHRPHFHKPSRPHRPYPLFPGPSRPKPHCKIAPGFSCR